MGPESTAPPGRPATLPYTWYRDPAVLDAERRRIFRRRWQYAGHRGQLPEPGTVAVARCGDVPVLLVRDREDVLRAFLNVCRHRGALLVEEDGACSSIQCPYHAWTYDLDGRLRAAPRSRMEPDFEPEGLGLVPLAVETWGPFVFVNPDADAEPLAEVLGGLPELVASAGVDVDALRFHSRTWSTYEANWKICCENFLECYHCQVAHPDLSKVIDVTTDGYRLEEARWYSSQYGPVRDDWSGSFSPVGQVPRGQFHFVYPNLTINIMPGVPNLSIGPVLPDGPEGTTRFLDYFFAPDADPGWIEAMMAWDDQIGVEDTQLVERVQKGVRTGLLEGGVLFETERLIAHFDAMVVQDLEGEAAAGA